MRCALILLSCVLAAGTPAAQTNDPKSRVVLVRGDTTLLGSLDGDVSEIRRMVSVGIKTLTGEKDEVAAWRRIVSGNDRVGIKISTQSGPLQSTRGAVVEAIAKGLRAVGIPASSIYVFDRDPSKMHAANYYFHSNATNFMQTVSVINGTSWDRDKFYENKLVGKLIWGDLNFGNRESELNTRSHLPNLLTKTITKLINVPVLQDNDAAGIWGCLYNVSLGAVDNSRRFEQPGRADAAIVQICSMPEIRGKLVLNVMDALVGGFAGGPAFKPQYSWPAASLYFSFDPVAIDATCLELIEKKRKTASVPPLAETAGHVKLAAQAGLGKSSSAEIQLIESR